MAGERVTVFGGTGFLGRRVVRRLAGEGWRVRVAAQHPAVPDGADPTRTEPVRADIRQEREVAEALEGADAAVNVVSLYVEQGSTTFQAIHVDGAARVARRAREAGVARLAHVSGIGSDPDAGSPYVAARGRSELAVRDAFPGANLLRPSVLFGPDDAFLRNLAAITRLPVVPLFGRGRTRLQPVYVGDVATAFARLLGDPGTAGRTHELGGGAVYTYREILELILAHQGRRRPLLPVPFAAWRTLAALAGLLPDPPLTTDQVALMATDNVVTPGAATFTDLGMEPAALAERLGECLPA
ncbi:complex I NDUFA9 subunit family protein [Thiohalorhabdus sp.]|uniref:complex I NDUFA9 subunit family protein n=1 Tax=Thiohalorhabdus sp. TaxID=3094134 RepID=UPI002FC33457